MSDSLQPNGLYSPWNSLSQNTGVGSLSLLQGNLPNPEIELRSPTSQLILYQLSHKGNKYRAEKLTNDEEYMCPCHSHPHSLFFRNLIVIWRRREVIGVWLVCHLSESWLKATHCRDKA